MSKFSRNRSFKMEQLEDRRLMAGDIRVFYNDGTLVLNEAPGSVGGNQAVWISQLPNGHIQLTGVTSPANAVGSLVNNASVLEVSDVRNIKVDFGGGQDTAIFHNTGDRSFQIQDVTVNTSSGGVDNDEVAFSNFKVLRSINVETGAGRDKVTFTNTKLSAGASVAGAQFLVNTGVASASGDDDKDVVQIDGLAATVDVTIKTGASGDIVTMKNSNLGTTSDHLVWFDLGFGDDSLTLGSGPNDFSAVTARHLRVDAGDGLDRVDMQDVFAIDGMSVQLGDGNDVLNMLNVQSHGGMSLNGQAGNDTMNLSQVEAFESFFARMGDGSDMLNVTALKARSATLDGGDGDGYDRLFLTLSPSINSLSRTGFEELNGQKLMNKNTIPGGGVATR